MEGWRPAMCVDLVRSRWRCGIAGRWSVQRVPARMFVVPWRVEAAFIKSGWTRCDRTVPK